MSLKISLLIEKKDNTAYYRSDVCRDEKEFSEVFNAVLIDSLKAIKETDGERNFHNLEIKFMRLK